MDTTELLFLALSKNCSQVNTGSGPRALLLCALYHQCPPMGGMGSLGEKGTWGWGGGVSVIVEMGPDHPAGAGFFQDLLRHLPESTVFLRCGLLLHSQRVGLGSD